LGRLNKSRHLYELFEAFQKTNTDDRCSAVRISILQVLLHLLWLSRRRGWRDGAGLSRRRWWRYGAGLRGLELLFQMGINGSSIDFFVGQVGRSGEAREERANPAERSTDDAILVANRVAQAAQAAKLAIFAMVYQKHQDCRKRAPRQTARSKTERTAEVIRGRFARAGCAFFAKVAISAVLWP